MAEYLVSATLNSGTGLADDRFVNNWCLEGVGFADPEDTADALSSFYLNTQGGAGALVPMYEYLSSVIDNMADKGLTLRVFDITGHLDGSPHGSPIFEKSYTVPVYVGPWSDLPSECAGCITLEAVGRDTALVEVPDGPDADTKRDRPKQRHTGRIYFGPLNTGAIEQVGGVIRISNQFRDTARAAVVGMVTNVRAIEPSANLAVWSRKDGNTRRADAVSVDNAVDIIRSRGEKPSFRERTLIPA